MGFPNRGEEDRKFPKKVGRPEALVGKQRKHSCPLDMPLILILLASLAKNKLFTSEVISLY